MVIGQINFTNVWPISLFFPYKQLANSVKIMTQVPTQLNHAMKNGEIHIGPISSFAYAENKDNYCILPNLSVSAHQKVGSILLFHKKPIEELGHGKVALPTTSATSVNLLKILLNKYYDASPNYFFAPPILDEMMKVADAALLIGDDAIKADWYNKQYMVTDLAQLWYKHTGHWMTFAVWAVQKDIMNTRNEEIQRIYDALQSSKEQGRTRIKEIQQLACEKIGGNIEYWDTYFHQLSYDFNEEQQQGLSFYFQCAQECGLLPHHITLDVLSNQTIV